MLLKHAAAKHLAGAFARFSTLYRVDAIEAWSGRFVAGYRPRFSTLYRVDAIEAALPHRAIGLFCRVSVPSIGSMLLKPVDGDVPDGLF